MAATLATAMPGSIRLFVPDDLAPGARIRASAGQAHYLGRVMRRAAGDDVLLFNGRDGEWRATIGPAPGGLTGLVVKDLVRPQMAASDVWLLLPPLRREATEWAVEKATELGTERIVLVTTRRTNPGGASLPRLVAVAAEAAEQCERLDVPDIQPARPLADVLASWPAGRALVAAVERTALPPPPRSGLSPVALLVGPEGGFDPAELDVLRRTPFVVLASLGPRVLRAETAAIAGLVLLQAGAPA